MASMIEDVTKELTTDATNEPKWLNTEEQAVWRAYLDVTRMVNERLNRQLVEDSQLSLAEYEILVQLSEHPERALRMSELAERAVNSRSRLTHTVVRMEQRGLVQRRPSAEDGRGVMCTLTEAGFDAIDTAAPAHVATVRASILDPLTPELVTALGEALDRIRASLRNS